MPRRPSSPTTWEEFASQLGHELQRRRLEAKLSQEDLAHLAGVTRNYYQLLEKGRVASGAAANPSIKVVVRLAANLGVSVDDLVPPTDRITF